MAKHPKITEASNDHHPERLNKEIDLMSMSIGDILLEMNVQYEEYQGIVVAHILTKSELLQNFYNPIALEALSATIEFKEPRWLSYAKKTWSMRKKK